jgi:hypothetical protein
MTHINQRRDTSVNWINADPVLHLGEVGWETNTLKAKLGDGVTAWTSLDYAIEPLTDLLIDAVNDGDLTHAPTGNAVYDAITEKIVQTVTNGDTTHSPSADAVFDAIASAVTGLWDDRGNYDASGNVFPSTGGSGAAGAVLKGDIWTVSVAGTLGGTAVDIGDTVRALVDTPGQTAGNWAIAENNTGYVAENAANKSTDGTMAANSATLYPSQSAAKTYADTVAAAKVSDTAYAGSWDGVTNIAPSKNAVYDYLQSLVVQTVTNGDTTHTPSADAVFDHVAAAVAAFAAAAADVVMFTAGGTFSKASYPNLKFVRVRVVGGGGGSAGAPATAGGQIAAGAGGGGGGYSEEIIPESALGANETVTVGAGGTAGAAGGAGGAGGTSSFGAHLQATGGAGGAINGPIATGNFGLSAGGIAAGGVGTLGDINLSGSPGRGAVAISSIYTGCEGGASQLAPAGGTNSGVGAAVAGSIYGGGATGAANNVSTAAKAGAVGGAGVVIVEVFT